jgi:hypothetical protein
VPWESVHRERQGGNGGRRAVLEEAARGRRWRVGEVEGDGRERRGGGERGAAHGVGGAVEERRRRCGTVVVEQRARGVAADGRAREQRGGGRGGGLGHGGGGRWQLVVVGALIRRDQHALVLRAPLHLHARVQLFVSQISDVRTRHTCMHTRRPTGISRLQSHP